jgi:chaperone LolA
MKPWFAALLLAILTPAAQAETAQEALSHFLGGVQTLSARFEQVQRDERGEVLQKTSGRMWLSRPSQGATAVGKFRWSYEKPYEQLMVCDGAKIWLYDPDLAQVTVRPAQQALAGTPAQLLSRRSALSDEFTVEDAGERSGARGARLTPKSADSDFKSIELWLRNDAPERMVFLDQLGGNTEVSFSELKSNIKLDEALFRFKPPKGVEVVEAVDGAAQP